MNKVWTKEESFVFRLQIGLKEKDMTITELAELTGIKPGTIRGWIRNIKCCHESFLPRIAEILGVSVYEMTQPLTDDEIKDLKGDGNA